MTLSIRLLGKPGLERDGSAAAPPKGRKAWALLAYLALSERPVPRTELAELLFADADDPLAALRWSLSQARRAIAPEAEIAGDPISLTLSSEAGLDVAPLLAGAPIGPAEDEAAGAELLGGIPIQASAAFETWLSVERHRLAASAEAALHEGALVQLTAGEAEAAVKLARRAVTLNPLEEANQELLVRCLAASGDREAALGQVRSCEELFRRELGLDPSPAVQRAADMPDPSRRSERGSSAAARGLLEAGQAAISAGATEAGITSLREACTEAARCRDPALRAEALVALGMALVHVVRGWDGEGAASLHQALRLAEQAGARRFAFTAQRELGWIGAVSGRAAQAQAHLAAAEQIAEGDEEVSSVLGVRGMQRSDAGAYEQAVSFLEESLGRAAATEDRRQAAFSGAMLARARMLRGELDDAGRLADAAIEHADAVGWLAYRPFPETTRAETDRLRGASERAAERFDHAFTVGCQLGDPCWEAFAARGLGLLAAEGGDAEEGARWLAEAYTRCTRWADVYVWAEGYVLDAATGLAISRGDPAAGPLATKLEQLASRAGLRELAARAMLHRAALGELGSDLDPSAVARQIDNPLLAEAMESAGLEARAPV